MAAVTPRRSSRIPHTHTPKMSERKKGLFQLDAEHSRGSLTQHRHLPVVDSESDSDDCDLGIISTLDSSSGDENAPRTPERNGPTHETRSHTKRLLKESQDFKNFIKSPFTLKKYQTRYSCPEKTSSTPATPRLQYHHNTPSSTHSCASVHTTCSTSSKARKSLASLIADTESCSSSLKDLNFDSDSPADSKENTPTKATRRSTRKLKMTPKFSSFKGVLAEQKTNGSPAKLPFVCLTKMDIATLSPTQMMRTPHNTSETTSPPKIHHRKPIVEIDESPEAKSDTDKNHKRLRNESFSETGPNSKYPKLDTSGTAPKARLSLFNSDKLKEILSAKSFYGKSNPEMNRSFTTKIATAIVNSTNQQRRVSTSHSRRKSRKPGQINLGVRHKIKKPKIQKNRIIRINRNATDKSEDTSQNHSVLSNSTMNNSSMMSQNTSQELDMDKADPFDKEKQTIDALLSQWDEEDIPDKELTLNKPVEVPCFNSSLIEETNQIFQPVTAVKVVDNNIQPKSEFIVELGSNEKEVSEQVAPVQDVAMSEPSHSSQHGGTPKGQFLPVEGGYIFVADEQEHEEEELLDLDEIERELQQLDEQILKMAASNNINAEAVLGTAEGTIKVDSDSESATGQAPDNKKLFSIFSNPNTGIATGSNKPSTSEAVAKKSLLKSVSDQYVIDAGQKNFGATQCPECGVIYEIGDPQDEHDHLVHHNATDVLKFNAWKDMNVVGNFPTGRCVMVRGSEPAWKRVNTLLERVVHPQLGYGAQLPRTDVYCYTAFLYIDKKQIVGCAIVEPKAKAYKMMPGDPDCCSVEDYPVKCGISRLWTHKSHRRQGVAARMLDCARATFLYGQALLVTDIAFSAPTTAGKHFATKYTGTENFYVYLQ